MYNHSTAKGRTRQGKPGEKAALKNSPGGQIWKLLLNKTRGSLFTTTAHWKQDQDQGKHIHNHSPAKTRARPDEAWGKPQPIKGETETGGSMCRIRAQQRQRKDRESLEKKNTAQQSQDKDRDKLVHNHISTEARPRLRKAWAKAQPNKAKNKTGVSLCTTTAQQRTDQDWGMPEHNHSPAKTRQRKNCKFDGDNLG